jgi:hypothetical protein
MMGDWAMAGGMRKIPIPYCIEGSLAKGGHEEDFGG